MKWNIMWSVFFVIPTSVMAMADRTPPVYGRPTLYGEYEVATADVQRAGKMYGDAPHVQPIRVAAPAQTHAAKHPVRPQKSGPRKKAKKKSVASTKAVVATARDVSVPEKVADVAADVVATADISDTARAAAPVVVAVEEVVAPVEKVNVNTPAPQPAPVAADIAVAASNKLDADSYCTSQAQAPSGNMPDGFILMSGRPDLMSCRNKK